MAWDTAGMRRVMSHEVFRADRSGLYDETRIVVRDSVTWRAVWSRVVSPGETWQALTPPTIDPPRLDFTREMVIVIGRGRSGCRLAPPVVDGIFEDGGAGAIHVVVKNPLAPMGAGCLPDASAPVLVLRLARSERPVHFVEVR